MAGDQQLLSLSGLALHAEFGDYNRRTMGHNYFVPEQYLPARVARRLGMAYVHDRALEAHRDALGLAPSQCEIQFIKVGWCDDCCMFTGDILVMVAGLCEINQLKL